MSEASGATRSRWLRASAVLLVTIGMLAFGLDRLVVPPDPATAELAQAEPLRTGAVVCGVASTTGADRSSLLLARAGQTGEVPAVIELDLLHAGERRAVAVPEVFPGSAIEVDLPPAGDVGAGVRWRGGPAAVFREWRTEQAALPAGLIAGPCPEVIDQRAVVPGMSTEGGNEARLRLANPFPTDASVTVTFVGAEGLLEPLALQNLSVAARSVQEIMVNEHLPQRSDLAAVVDIRTGRVGVEGMQIARAEIGGIDAVSLLEAAPQPSELWVVPWLSASPADRSWLWITNLGLQPAIVELTYATEQGGVVPEGLGELTVPEASLVRVELRGTYPQDAEAVSLVARSDGNPVFVSGAVERRADTPSRSALAVGLGASAADASWTLVGGATQDRDERVRIVNPGSEEAVVAVTAFAGRSPRVSDELAAVPIGPGAAIELHLDEVVGDVGPWAVFVVAEQGEVVVGRAGADGLVPVTPEDPETPETPQTPTDVPAAAPVSPDAPETPETPESPTEPSENSEPEQATAMVLVRGWPGAWWWPRVPGFVAEPRTGLSGQLAPPSSELTDAPDP